MNSFYSTKLTKNLDQELTASSFYFPRSPFGLIQRIISVTKEAISAYLSSSPKAKRSWPETIVQLKDGSFTVEIDGKQIPLHPCYLDSSLHVRRLGDQIKTSPDTFFNSLLDQGYQVFHEGGMAHVAAPSILKGGMQESDRLESKSNETDDVVTHLIPQKTPKDGNCSFHAVFGEWDGTEFIAPEAEKMREVFNAFLSSFKSLKEIPEPLNYSIRTVLLACRYGQMHNYTPSKAVKALFASNDNFNQEREKEIKQLHGDFYRKIVHHLIQFDTFGKALAIQALFDLANAQKGGTRAEAGIDLRKQLGFDQDLEIPIDKERIIEKIKKDPDHIKKYFKAKEKDLALIINGSSMLSYIPLLPENERKPFERLKLLLKEVNEGQAMTSLLEQEEFYKDYLKHVRERGNDYYLWIDELAILSALSGRKITVMTRHSQKKGYKVRVEYNLSKDISVVKNFKGDLSIFPSGGEVVIYNNGINHYERMKPLSHFPAKVPSAKEKTKISKLIDQLESGLKEEDEADFFQALEELDRSIVLSTDDSILFNPLRTLDRLIGIIGFEGLEGPDVRIKREIARIAHRFLYAVYYKNQKGELINTKKKTELLEKLKAARDKIDKKNPARSSLKFEIQVLEAGIELLTDQTNKETAIQFITWLLDTAKAIKELDARKALEKIFGDAGKKILEMAVKKSKKQWYEEVQWIELVGALAITNTDDLTNADALAQLQMKIQKLTKNHDWHILYAGLSTLQKIIEKSKIEDLRIRAFFGDKEKRLPGLLHFKKWELENESRFSLIKTLSKDKSWKIREKVAECAILFNTHPIKEIREEALALFKEMVGAETNDKVRITLDNVKFVREVKEKLEKDWGSKPIEIDQVQILEQLDSIVNLMESRLREIQLNQSSIIKGLAHASDQLGHLDRKSDMQTEMQTTIKADVIHIKNRVDKGNLRDVEELVSELREEQTRQIKDENRSLPILDMTQELVQAVNDHKVVIVWGEQGSGKTFQLQKLTLYLWEQYKEEGLIPLYINLAEIIQPGAHDPFKDLMINILKKYNIKKSKEISELKKRKLLLLVDHIEMIKPDLMDHLYDRLIGSGEWQLQIIVSCTSHAVPKSVFAQREICFELSLPLFNADQQQKFFQDKDQFLLFKGIPILGSLLENPLALSLAATHMNAFADKAKARQENAIVQEFVGTWIKNRIKKMGKGLSSETLLKHVKEIAVWMIREKRTRMSAVEFASDILKKNDKDSSLHILRCLPLRQVQAEQYEFLTPLLRSYLAIEAFIEAGQEIQKQAAQKKNKSFKITKSQIDALGLAERILEIPGIFEFLYRKMGLKGIEQFLRDTIKSLASFSNMVEVLGKLTGFLEKMTTLKKALPLLRKLPEKLLKKMNLPNPNLPHLDIPNPPHLPHPDLPNLPHLPHPDLPQLPWEELSKLKNLISEYKRILSYLKRGCMACGAGVASVAMWYFFSPESLKEKSEQSREIVKYSWNVLTTALGNTAYAVGTGIITLLRPPAPLQSQILSDIRSNIESHWADSRIIESFKPDIKKSMEEIAKNMASVIPEEANASVLRMVEVLHSFRREDGMIGKGLEILRHHISKLEASKNYTMAEEVAKKGLNLVFDTFGSESKQAKDVYEDLARISRSAKKRNRAKEYAGKANDIKKKLLIEDEVPVEEETDNSLELAQNFKEQFQNMVQNPLSEFAIGERNIDNVKVIKHLANSVVEDGKFKDALWKIVKHSKKKLSDEQQDKRRTTAAANAITALNAAKVSFSGKDLRGIRVPRADLRQGNFYGCDFRKSDLTGVKFQKAQLGKAKFHKAVVDQVEWGESPWIPKTEGVLIGVSQDNSQLIFKSEGFITFFDIETRKETRRISLGEGNVKQVVFDKSFSKFLIKNEEESVFLLDIGTKNKITTTQIFDEDKEYKVIAMNEEGTMAAMTAIGSKEFIVKDLESRKTISECFCGEELDQIVFKKINDKDAIVGMTSSGKVIFWDIKGDKRIVEDVQYEHFIETENMALTEDGTILALAGRTKESHQVVLWNIQEERVTKILQSESDFASARELFFSPDASRVGVNAGSHVIIWDVKSGEVIDHFSGEQAFLFNFRFLNPSGEKIVLNSNKHFQIISPIQRAPLLHNSFKGDSKHSVHISSDWPYVIQSSSEGIQLFDIKNGKIVKNLKGKSQGVLSPTQKQLAFTQYKFDKEKLIVFDYDQNKELWSDSLSFLSYISHEMGYSKSGKTIVSIGQRAVSFSKQVIIWNAENGAKTVHETAENEQVIFANDQVLTIRPKLKIKVMGDYQKAEAKFLIVKNLETNQENEYQLPKPIDSVKNLRFFSDGKTLAFTDHKAEQIIWLNRETKEVVLSHNEQEKAIDNLFYNQDGSLTASVHADGRLNVWNTISGERIWKADQCRSGLFSPDGVHLLIERTTGECQLWDNKGKLLSTIDRDINSYKFTENGKNLVTGHKDGSVRFWDMENFIDRKHPTLLWSKDSSLNLYQASIINKNMPKEVRTLLRQKGAVSVVEFSDYSFPYGHQLIENKEVIQSLVEQVKSDSEYKRFLWSLVKTSKQKIENDERADKQRTTRAANAMTVLNAAKISFSEKDLSGIRIPGANLRGGLFDSTDFSGADLTGVNMSRAWLNDAKIDDAMRGKIIFEDYPSIDLRKHFNREIYVKEMRFSSPKDLFVKVMPKNNDTIVTMSCSLETGACSKISTEKGKFESFQSYNFDKSKMIKRTGKGLELWDLKANKQIKVLDDYFVGRFSPKGDEFVAAKGADFIFFNSMGEPISEKSSVRLSINHFAYSPDGNLLLITLISGFSEFFDVKERKFVDSWLNYDLKLYIRLAEFSSDGKNVATSSLDGQISFWNLDELINNRETDFRGHHEQTVVHSPDHLTYITGCGDRGTTSEGQMLWDAKTKKSQKLVGSRAKYTTEGKWVIAWGSSVHATLYDTHTQKTLDVLPKILIDAEPVFSPKGNLMVLMEKGILSFWEVGTWKKLSSIITDLKTYSSVKTPSFSADGSKLYTASPESVKVWDVRKVHRGQRPRLLERHGRQLLMLNSTKIKTKSL